MNTPNIVTRFAPSPTGYLHIGHVLSCLYVFAIGRSLNAKIILRIEDHDRSRCQKRYEDEILIDLEWLGFKFDNHIDTKKISLYRQSDHQDVYEKACAELLSQGLAYYCDCSREMIKKRTQHLGVLKELHYDGFCRLRGLSASKHHALRIKIPTDEVVFNDLHLGVQTQIPNLQCGDFVIKDRDGNFSYQFCVVIDDDRHGVNLVVRGQDILPSTGRQILLAKLLGIRSPLQYCHHPLIFGVDGKKLSKKDGAGPIKNWRLRGQNPEHVFREILAFLGESHQIHMSIKNIFPLILSRLTLSHMG